MGRIREVMGSRDKVVECFLTRRSKASLDGSVYTDGSTLCVGYLHVAFWHQGTIYVVYLEYPDSLAKNIQAMIRLGDHGHRVAEVGVENGRSTE